MSVRSHAEGVPVVTIPLADYEQLLECRRFREAHERQKAAYAPASRSPIERDPEVAAFLTVRFGKLDVKAIVKECRAAFGAERTPSASAVHRYWQRLRGTVTPRRKEG